ncbi:MAG: hypothetical protein WCD88_12450 [Desulfobacterales bacterium]
MAASFSRVAHPLLLIRVEAPAFFFSLMFIFALKMHLGACGLGEKIFAGQMGDKKLFNRERILPDGFAGRNLPHSASSIGFKIKVLAALSIGDV